MAKRAFAVFSHWYHLLEDLQESPQNFYASLEQAIKRRELPDVSVSRVGYLEGGILSAKREYLRAQRKEYLFDICAAPFGNGFFVSSWLSEVQSVLGPYIAVAATFFIFFLAGGFMIMFGFFQGIFLACLAVPLLFWALGYLISEGKIADQNLILEVPVLGPIYERLFRPITYYRMDTALMFQESIHAAVLETVDQMTQSKGKRLLSGSERKPILNSLFS